MFLYKSSNTLFGSYLKGAQSFKREHLENIMPALDLLFNNPNTAKADDLVAIMKKNGVPTKFLRDFYDGYRVNNNGEEAFNYAKLELRETQGKRDDSDYYNSFKGKNFWVRADIKVTDESSLMAYMRYRFDERLKANKGFLDAWVVGKVYANWNDPRYRPIVLMMDQIKRDYNVSFDTLQQALPDIFWEEVNSMVKIKWSQSPSQYQEHPDAMDEVINGAIATVIGNYYPTKEINPSGDRDDPPWITWSKQSLIADAEINGGWGPMKRHGFTLDNDIISADIGMKLSMSGVSVPPYTPAEEIGLEVTDEKWAKSWLDIDFHTQFSHRNEETGLNEYSIWYFDQFGNKVQIMSDNKDGTRSPLYYNYFFESSMVYAAMTRYYEKNKEKGNIESLGKLLDSVSSRGILPGQLKTHQDRDYFRRLIPKLFDEVGVFDESYFGDCESQDFCYKVKKAGYKNYRAHINQTHEALGFDQKVSMAQQQEFSQKVVQSRNLLHSRWDEWQDEVVRNS